MALQKMYLLVPARDKYLYGFGIIYSIASGTILPLMTLIFGKFVSVFTDFAIGRLDSATFRGKVDHYT